MHPPLKSETVKEPANVKKSEQPTLDGDGRKPGLAGLCSGDELSRLLKSDAENIDSIAPVPDMTSAGSEHTENCEDNVLSTSAKSDTDTNTYELGFMSPMTR